MTSGTLSPNTFSNQRTMMWGAVGLALLAALAYVLIALHVLGLGDFPSATAPAAIVYTDLTGVLDLGIIAPSSILAGILLLRRKPLGTLLAATLMIVLSIVAVTVSSQTVFQTLAGLTFEPPVYIFKVGSFVVLGAFAVGLIVKMMKSIAEGEAPTVGLPAKARKVAKAARV